MSDCCDDGDESASKRGDSRASDDAHGGGDDGVRARARAA